jgi:hypothetical protein
MLASENRLLLPALFVLQILTLGILVWMLANPVDGGITHNPQSATQNPASHAKSIHGDHAITEIKATLRKIVREELAALAYVGDLADSHSNNNHPAHSDATLETHDPHVSEQAVTTSSSIIRQAASTGVWTKADTQALLPHIGNMSGQQRLALAEQFYDAINRQQLALEDFPPL